MTVRRPSGRHPLTELAECETLTAGAWSQETGPARRVGLVAYVGGLFDWRRNRGASTD